MLGLITGILTVATLALAVVDIGISVCKNLGIIKPEVDAQELGDRALQARDGGILAEDYDGRYQEYMDAINDFEVDPEKSKAYKVEDKLKAAGEVVGWGLVEHYGKDSGVDKFIENELTKENKEFYQPDRVTAYLEEFHEDNTDMGKIGEYFDNKLNSLEDVKIIDAKLVAAEKNLGVDDEAEKKLDAEIERRAEE